MREGRILTLPHMERGGDVLVAVPNAVAIGAEHRQIVAQRVSAGFRPS
jgi:hypothetical protein